MKAMIGSSLSSISTADSCGATGEFWDTHDFAEFDHPNQSDVACQIALPSAAGQDAAAQGARKTESTLRGDL